MKCSHFTDRVRSIIIEEVLLAIKADQWYRQEFFQIFPDPDRPSARSTAAVRRCKRFVQVKMDDVESHVSRTDLPQYGVEVRSIVVQETPGVMNDFRDFE